MANRNEQILETCEKIFDNIENGESNGSTVLLLCKRIARLANDDEAITWLSYETGGYPYGENGYIIHEAWVSGAKHGRKYISNKKEYIFTELMAELEEGILSCSKALNNFSTSGASFQGEKALLAANAFTREVHNSTIELVKASKEFSRKKSVLLGEYYKYALNKQIEVQFGNINKSIFEKYQERVDKYLSLLDKNVYEKLRAVNLAMERNNLESNSQALTSCRKIFATVADELFSKILSDFEGKTFKTQEGKMIDISVGHTKNRLSAVIETMTCRKPKNTLVGSNVVYLVDLLDRIADSQSDGVHNDVCRETAEQCVIQTYIALGNILELFDSYSKENSVKS